jgi:dipeptidyl aminopeptidase/acylaminoacyl peptidase
MPAVSRSVAAAILGSLLALAGPASAQKAARLPQARAVTVADEIAMARVAGSPYAYFSPKTGFAVFSPNGKYFAIVVSRGNLERNANVNSLLVFRTDHINVRPTPKTLTVFESSSNRPGISRAKWLADSDTLLFLGSRGTGPTELYSIQYSSGHLKKLTNRTESLVSYGMSNNGSLVYAAERPVRSILNERTLRYGFDVSSEHVSDVVRGLILDREPEIFLRSPGAVKDRALKTEDPFDSAGNDLFISPNGRYLIVKTDSTRLPESWRQYDDESVQRVFRRNELTGDRTFLLHYMWIDLRTGRSDLLLDAPATYLSSDVLWSPDSRSVLLSGTYLPLNVADPAELQARRKKKFVVEIGLDGREITKITDEDLEAVRWDQQTNIVSFTVGATSRGVGSAEKVYYQKVKGIWERLGVAPRLGSASEPDVFQEEDLNLPPRIVAVDSRTHRKTELLSLNSQFTELALGKEQEIRWSSPEGARLNAGLYLPPDYVLGQRYPLVIQTHGFDPHGFWMDGPYSSAFAARPLASRQIVVLQMNDIFSDTLETAQEAGRVAAAYQSAIDYLDERGIIDPERVGLIGFSRTCLYVKYLLTHSSRHFAAALVADGVDASYFQYLLSYNSNPALASDFDQVLGGPPFGGGLSLWVKDSPGFLLDKVQTPLLIQAIGPGSLLDEWQWFGGLKRLGKAVDLIYMPTGVHVLVRPWDRMVSEQATIDWFCFWLKSEEDPSPEKQDRYKLWRELRAHGSPSWHAR